MYDFDSTTPTQPPEHEWLNPSVFETAALIAIVGSSGSGKSLLGRKICESEFTTYLSQDEENCTLMTQIDEGLSRDLLTIGLKSLPAWTRPNEEQ